MKGNELETAKQQVIENLSKAESLFYISTEGSEDFKLIAYGDPDDIENMLVSIISKKFPSVKKTLFTMEMAGFARRFLAETKEDKKDSEETEH